MFSIYNIGHYIQTNVFTEEEETSLSLRRANEPQWEIAAETEERESCGFSVQRICSHSRYSCAGEMLKRGKSQSVSFIQHVLRADSSFTLDTTGVMKTEWCALMSETLRASEELNGSNRRSNSMNRKRDLMWWKWTLGQLSSVRVCAGCSASSCSPCPSPLITGTL